MRSFSEILGSSEEKENIKSGGVVIATVCALIVVLFLALNLNLGVEPKVSGDEVTVTAEEQY